jgi:hypothetical protein
VNDIKVSKQLQTPCGKFPKLNAQAGEPLEKAVLVNRNESESVLADCDAKHQGVLQAAGLKMPSKDKLSRWEIFKVKLGKPTQKLKE